MKILYIIFLLIFFIIQNSISTVDKNGIKINKIEIKKGQCVKKISEILFVSKMDLHLIVNENFINVDLYQTLHKFFSITIQNSKIVESEKKKEYIVIVNNFLDLKNLFNISSFSKESNYLILINSSPEIFSYAEYLYKNEFYYIAFLLIDKNEEIFFNQYNARWSDNKTNDNSILMTKVHCNDNFLKSKNNKKIRSFNEIICPINGCTFYFWRLRSDDNVQRLYRVTKRGFIKAESYSVHILYEFARKFGIRVKSALNNSDLNVNWEIAVKYVLKGKVNLIFGHTFPDAEIIQPLEIATYTEMQYLLMMDAFDDRINFTGLNRFFAPLELEIWLYLLLLIIWYSLFMYLVRKIYNKKLIREYLHPEGIFQMFMKQIMILPENCGLRIVVGMMLTFSLLIISSYECTITSTFFIESPQIHPKNLKDLMIFKYRFAGPEFIRYFFNDSTDPVMEYLYKSYEIKETDEIVNLMNEENLIMMQTSDRINQVILKNRRNMNFHVSQKPILFYPIIFFLQKGHPYAKTMEKFVTLINESGIGSRWWERFKDKVHFHFSDDNSNSIKFLQMTFCWFLLFYGWIISLLVFIVEFIIQRFMG